MNAPEALRSIRYDLLSYIQERVRVDFDNVSRLPLHFFYRMQRYKVREVLRSLQSPGRWFFKRVPAEG